MKCVRCQGSDATKARGLCAACYWRPGVRHEYPLLACKSNHRGVLECDPGVDPEPVGDIGREAMLDVLIGRAERGERLSVKGDRRGS